MKALKQSNQDSLAPAKPLRKLLLLTLVKESYLFAKNSYGFIVHPFVTARKIERQKDFSQGILFFGLPILIWIGWALVLLVSRFVIFGKLKFGILAKGSFLAVSFFSALIISYLLFWGWQTLKRKEK